MPNAICSTAPREIVLVVNLTRACATFTDYTKIDTSISRCGEFIFTAYPGPFSLIWTLVREDCHRIEMDLGRQPVASGDSAIFKSRFLGRPSMTKCVNRNTETAAT